MYEFIAEGTFDGENMVTESGKVYFVPGNYASKSLLIEGDILQLRHGPTGMVFKQSDLVPRKFIKAVVVRADKHSCVISDGKGRRFYNVLPASCSYHKLRVGVEVAASVRADGEGTWAAIHTVIIKDFKDVDKEMNI